MLRDFRSELDLIPGIGSKRRRVLLNAFGSVSGVRRATLEEVRTVVGPRVAAVVIDYFSTSA
jgi:excinuclease ABC subunit C